MNNLNKLFEENIKNNLKENNYIECIKLLKSKINEIFTKKIIKILPDFKYTSLIDLLDIGTPILSKEDAIELNKYYLIVRNDSANEFKIHKLMEVYKKIK